MELETRTVLQYKLTCSECHKEHWTERLEATLCEICAYECSVCEGCDTIVANADAYLYSLDDGLAALCPVCVKKQEETISV